MFDPNLTTVSHDASTRRVICTLPPAGPSTMHHRTRTSSPCLLTATMQAARRGRAIRPTTARRGRHFPQSSVLTYEFGGNIAVSTPNNIIFAEANGDQPYYTTDATSSTSPGTRSRCRAFPSWSNFMGAYYSRNEGHRSGPCAREHLLSAASTASVFSSQPMAAPTGRRSVAAQRTAPRHSSKQRPVRQATSG